MAITLTKYIYPIEKEIILSNELGYSIDNPRTEEEIRLLKDYIHPALKRNWENSGPHYNPMLSAAFAISTWRDYMKGRDEYVHNYLQKNYGTEIEDIISQSWIILRYKDNGEFEKAKKDKNNFFDIFFTDARHAYWEKYHLLLSYCQLISLLIHDDNRYVGDSFVLLKKPQDIFYPLDHTHEIIEAFTTFHGNCSIGNDNRGKTWNFFPDIRNLLGPTCNTIEIALKNQPPFSVGNSKKQSTKEKILFIGDLLRVIENETQDVNVKLLLLVSIIEFLITRNPDTNRFNVEDSIRKQFILKASVLIYNDNKQRNLEELKKELKLIYDQRSNVAHGSYISSDERKKMIESFYSLYEYIKAIVFEYLKDPQFVDYLKES
jgi:hypothetical protein